MNTSYLVRNALTEDIPSILSMLKHYADMGDLLPRSESDLSVNLQHFIVVKEDEKVIACGSLEHFTEELAEIRSLVVNTEHQGKGLARLIVEKHIHTAKQRNVKRLMALTYVPQFFHELGFEIVKKEIFPEKIWGICVNCYKFNNCDEIAVLLELN